MAEDRWMTKHFTQENPESLKCNYCRTSFSNQYDQRQMFKKHLCDVHDVTELDGYPEGDIIQQNYKISGQTATCNHCKKKIVFTHGVYYLKTHLKIDHHDKCNLVDGNIRSKIWDEYNITGNYATCKYCKMKCKLLSAGPTLNLWNHMKIHHPDECILIDRNIRNVTNVWHEYNIADNYAICKECNIKFSLHDTNPTEYLSEHLKIYHTNKYNLINIKRKSNIWDEYNVTGNYATCKECKKEVNLHSIKPTRYLWKHLKIDHPNKYNLIDMVHRSKHSNIWDKYIITGNSVTCKKCKKTLRYNIRNPASLWKHLKSKRCQTSASTSKSIEDNEFHSTMIPQSEMETFNETKFKQEIEETNFNFGDATSTSTSVEGNDFHNIMESQTQVFDQTKSIKQEIGITEFYFVDASSMSNSIGDNDFHGIMKPQSETQTFEQTKPTKQEIETTDLNFGSKMETRARKAAEVATEIQMNYEEAFDDASSEEEGDEYLKESSSAESEENAESDIMDHLDMDCDVGLDVTLEPDVNHSKKKGRPRSYLNTVRNFKWSFNAPETRDIRRSTFETIEAGAKYAARNVTTPLEAWSLLLPDNILNKIVVHTNEEIERQRLKLQTENKTIQTHYHCVTLLELKAFIGLLYYAGLNKLNNTDVRRLWSPLSMPLFKATMQEDRFLFLLICLRFDNKETRAERQEIDNFSYIREIWSDFIANCIKYYEPSGTCTVGEQLFGFRGRCRFRMYVPRKLNKYGLKIISLNDAKTFYMINAIPYVGKLQDKEPNEAIPTYYVRRVCEPIYNSGRNVTCDNWFTSVPLVDKMKRDYNITIVGTIKKNKVEIPYAFKKIPTEGNSQFAYHDRKTLVSYNPEKRKIVLLLSSLHTSGKIDEKSGKPEIVSFYNKTKEGTDVFNQLVHEYSTCRRTKRWPMRYFYGILDQAAINCFILYTFNLQNKKKRYVFMEELSLSLIKPHLATRLTSSTLRLNVRLFIESILSASEIPEHDDSRNYLNDHVMETRKRCRFCPYTMHRKTQYKCLRCHLPMCQEHRAKICEICSSKNE